MLRVSHCAHFIFHSRRCATFAHPAPSDDTPFVDVQRKLVRNESVLGFATGSASGSESESESCGSVAHFFIISLYFFAAVATAEVLCNRHFCVLREGSRQRRLAQDHREGRLH